MFTGKRAFEATTLAELLRLHESGTVAACPRRSCTISIRRSSARSCDASSRSRPASGHRRWRCRRRCPGGDPLAAALAAGETPSPEMVAAAGEQSALKPAIGLALVAFTLVMLGILVAQSQRLAVIASHPAAEIDRLRCAIAPRSCSRSSATSMRRTTRVRAGSSATTISAGPDGRTHRRDLRRALATGRPGRSASGIAPARGRAGLDGQQPAAVHRPIRRSCSPDMRMVVSRPAGTAARVPGAAAAAGRRTGGRPDAGLAAAVRRRRSDTFGLPRGRAEVDCRAATPTSARRGKDRCPTWLGLAAARRSGGVPGPRVFFNAIGAVDQADAGRRPGGGVDRQPARHARQRHLHADRDRRRVPRPPSSSGPAAAIARGAFRTAAIIFVTQMAALMLRARHYASFEIEGGRLDVMIA